MLTYYSSIIPSSLKGAYYSQNYASIIGQGLATSDSSSLCNPQLHSFTRRQRNRCCILVQLRLSATLPPPPPQVIGLNAYLIETTLLIECSLWYTKWSLVIATTRTVQSSAIFCLRSLIVSILCLSVMSIATLAAWSSTKPAIYIHCKNIWVTSTKFWSSQLHACMLCA